MLFQQRFWTGIEDGSITLTFRRWRRPQVVAGRPYRTAGGIVEVDAVDTVEPGDVTDDDAARAGYPSAAALLGDLRGSPELPITRVRFHRAAGPDPRAVLAGTADLDDAAVAEISRRLDRLDRARGGPWTRRTLQLIAANPAVRAAELAAAEGRETAPFKLDVRKLKHLGLTISLGTGYRISPRGAAYLDRTAPTGPHAAGRGAGERQTVFRASRAASATGSHTDENGGA